MGEVPLAAASTSAMSPPWWRVFSEFAYFAALSAVIGGALVYLLIVRPLSRSGVDATNQQAARRHSARSLAWCGPLFIVAAYLQLAARAARATKEVSFAQGLAPSRMVAFLTAPANRGEWVSTGTLILIQSALFALAVVALLSLFIRERPTLVAALALTATVLGSLVISVPTNLRGQTVETQLDTWLTQAHIIAACTWLGGLISFATMLRLFGKGSGHYGARASQRFSTVAMVAVGTLITSGSWLAWRHVGNLGQLVSTTYGRFLLVKLLIVATVVSAGAYNQLVLTPRLARVHATSAERTSVLRHFSTMVAVEATLGLCVLLIVPFLTGSARSQAGQASAPTLDMSILALGVVLVATLGASLYTTYRISLALTQRALTRIT